VPPQAFSSRYIPYDIADADQRRALIIDCSTIDVENANYEYQICISRVSRALLLIEFN